MYDALDKEACTNCYTPRKKEDFRKQKLEQPGEQAAEIHKEPERAVPEEEVPLD